METIIWSNAFSVNNEELDSQHKDFLALIRESYTKISSKLNPGELNNLLDRLYEHADKHFSTEEKYFREFGYVHAKEHTGEHNKIRTEILRFKERHKNDMSEKLAWELVDFLENWLVDHIMKQDKLYADSLKSNESH